MTCKRMFGRWDLETLLWMPELRLLFVRACFVRPLRFTSPILFQAWAAGYLTVVGLEGGAEDGGRAGDAAGMHVHVYIRLFLILPWAVDI